MIWLYQGQEVLELPEDTYGFIYQIVYTDGKRYIGKKNCYSLTKKYLTKKELAEITDNRLKKYKMVKKESKWREYTGSLKSAEDKRIAYKEILMFCKDKINLTYAEAEIMFKLDVLRDDTYLNENILGAFYKGRIS